MLENKPKDNKEDKPKKHFKGFPEGRTK